MKKHLLITLTTLILLLYYNNSNGHVLPMNQIPFITNSSGLMTTTLKINNEKATNLILGMRSSIALIDKKKIVKQLNTSPRKETASIPFIHNKIKKTQKHGISLNYKIILKGLGALVSDLSYLGTISWYNWFRFI